MCRAVPHYWLGGLALSSVPGALSSVPGAFAQAVWRQAAPVASGDAQVPVARDLALAALARCAPLDAERAVQGAVQAEALGAGLAGESDAARRVG